MKMFLNDRLQKKNKTSTRATKNQMLGILEYIVLDDYSVVRLTIAQGDELMSFHGSNSLRQVLWVSCWTHIHNHSYKGMCAYAQSEL